MPLISRLERRFGRFAIPHLTTAIVAGQAALWVANLLPQGVSIDRVVLDPAKVMQGEAWRLVTFLFTPPADRSILTVFYFLLLHLFGSTLERQWGVFRFNVFLFTGWLANVAAAFVASSVMGQEAAAAAGGGALQLASIYASNTFFYSSLFLAFARLYPDFILNLFFVLPIRIKWLALLMWIGYAYALVTGDWTARMLILATILNYLMFFGPEHWSEFKHGHRRRSFQAKATHATSAATHTCVVCGLSSDESPRTLFRYCSKCAGQRCYCPEHIRNHEHVTEKEPVV
jgi:hypothetical protein